jgi:hypothetical protein
VPKRTYKILRFDGGINNDANPRDIGDNQLQTCTNLAIDEMGRVKLLGDIQTTYKVVTGFLTGEGNGLFACTTDHMGLLDGSVAALGQTYYLVEHGDFISGIGSTDEGTVNAIACDFGTKGPTMFYVDGALRIANADHDAGGTTPIWRGYISPKTYNPGSASGITSIVEQWATESAEVKGAFEVFTPSHASLSTNVTSTEFCKNAIMINVQDDSGDATDFNQAASCNATDANYDGYNVSASSDHEWGFQLEFDESDDGNGSGTWMPTTTTRYKFYITTMYDNHVQESLPQLFRMYGSRQLGSLDGATTWHNKVVESEIYFTNGDTNEIGENVAIFFAPMWKTIGTAYNFGASGVGTADSGNPRISGVRVYWASNEDAYTSLWQMFDIKFDEGAKVIGVDGGGGGVGGYSPFKENAGAAGHVSIDLSTANVWTNPPRYFQYDVLNAHSSTDIIKIDSYKTAVVANRRVYIGNIKQDGVIHGDRMLKSPVNQFDKFPSINNIDVATHDGDDIVALVEYADRILQFKNNTCYIINVSGNSEYLEAEHKFKGISNPGAVCRTDYGVAWANLNGCYLYDGQVVTDLLEAQGMRKINKAIWREHIEKTGTSNGHHRVGFNPFKRQLIVLGGASIDNAAYVYDMITKSWVESNDMISDINGNSNFINDPVDGSLLIYDQGGTTIDKWTDTPASTPLISFKTKEIDFGEPAIRKKVYKVRMTYNGDASGNVGVYYLTNGSASTNTFNSDQYPLSSVSTPTHIELTPTTSADANNIYSFTLYISGPAGASFEIDDITIIYKLKGVR